MAEKSKKPAIRFAGFTEAWEQRKLSGLANETNGGGTPKTSVDSYWNGNIPWIQSSDIKENEVLAVDIKKTISQEAISNSATKLIPKNSIAIVTRVGVGKLAIIPFSYTTSQDFLSLSGLKTDLVFTAYLLYKKMQSDLNSVQGTAIKGITKEELLNKNILLPELAEQDLIGKYFQQLDNLITLHQRKYDKLVNVKKAMLEKMFPKDGADVPEIRFKGFTEAWEQRKLGDIVDRVVRKNTNNESMLALTISAQYGLVDQITYFNNRVASRDLSNYFLVLNGEFAYNKSTSDGYPFGAVKRLDLYDKGVLSTLYIVFVPKSELSINSDFLTVFFDTDRWHKDVSERAAEGARNHGLLNISAEDFFDIDLVISKYIEEQKQIGELFRSFDNLITLHQRKLEKLKNLKKACLEKMFV